MRDVYDVLRTKEMLIEQLGREIEALRLAVRLVSDDADNGPLEDAPGTLRESDPQLVRSKARVGGTRLPEESDRGRTAIIDDETLGTAQRISRRLKRLARPVLKAVNPLAS